VLVFLEHDRNWPLCVNIHVIMLVVGLVRSVLVSVEGQSCMENSDVISRWFAMQLVVRPHVTVCHIENCELQDISWYIS
jgi:hypothetical protein